MTRLLLWWLLVLPALVGFAAQQVLWEEPQTVGRGAWGRMAFLTNQTWLLVHTVFPPGAPSRWRLLESVDRGRAWTVLSEVTEPGRKLDNGHLLVRPDGVVLLTGRSLIDGQSYRLPVYASTNGGRSWTPLGLIDAHEGAPDSLHGRGLWEPHLTLLGQGQIAACYASEKHAGYSQIIGQRISTNGGATWGPEIRAVTEPGGGRLRPGMPVLTRCAGGDYLLVYEVVGLGRGDVYRKRSRDGVTWAEGLGDRIPRQEAGPFALAMDDGRVLVTSCANLLSAAEGSSDHWHFLEPPPFPLGFRYSWPALYQTGPGEIVAVVSAGGIKLRFGQLSRLETSGARPPDPSPARLDRHDLLRFRAADGSVRPVRTLADWEERRREIVAGAERIMGPLPGARQRGDLGLTIEEEVDCGNYVRRLISYLAEPEGRVPAYLLVPKIALAGGKPCPGVLCLHPTDARLGHKVVVGLGGLTNRQYGVELAERGYVVLAPSYPQLANYQPDLAALGYASGTMKAIWDNIRGLDLLESMPFVKRGGFGAIGHSLGGHNAVYTAVFDRRVTVVVSSCGLDSYLDYYREKPDMWLPGQGWTQTRYMPRLAAFRGRLAEIPFDFHELIGALAPRVCFISAPLRDGNFKWQSVDAIAAAAGPVYRLHGQPENLRVEHPDCDHDFPAPMRELAYRLFDQHLR